MRRRIYSIHHDQNPHHERIMNKIVTMSKSWAEILIMSYPWTKSIIMSKPWTKSSSWANREQEISSWANHEQPSSSWANHEQKSVSWANHERESWSWANHGISLKSAKIESERNHSQLVMYTKKWSPFQSGAINFKEIYLLIKTSWMWLGAGLHNFSNSHPICRK